MIRDARQLQREGTRYLFPGVNRREIGIVSLISWLMIAPTPMSTPCASAEEVCEGACLVRLLIGLEHEVPEAREVARAHLLQRWTDERQALADFGTWMQPSQPAELAELLKEPSMQRAILELLLAKLEHAKWKLELIGGLAAQQVYYPMLSLNLAVAPLRALMRDRDPAVRARAARTLGELAERARSDYGTDADYAAATAEVAAMLADPEPESRSAAVSALAQLHAREQLRAILERLDDDAPRVRAEAIGALATLDGGQLSQEHRRDVAPRLQDADAQVRAVAIQAISAAGGAEFAERIAQGLGDGQPEVRAQAINALAQLNARQFVKPVHDLLEDRDARVRAAAALALAQFGELAAAGSIAKSMTDPDASVRAAAIQALARLGATAYTGGIAQRLTGDERSIRCLAAWALWKLNAREQVPALKARLNDVERCRDYVYRQPGEDVDFGQGEWETVRSSAAFVLRSWSLSAGEQP